MSVNIIEKIKSLTEELKHYAWAYYQNDAPEITDAEYESRLIRTYEIIPPKEWNEYMRIVKKAVFSGAEVCDDEAQFCYGIYRKLDNKR